tara:strand:- start:131 stop:982 length:852 start_codon:yes stop_codon:yes gene_type:complete
MIIWIASYPKSGNTWVRTIISSLLHTNDGLFDFSNLKKVDQYPQKCFFEGLTNEYNNIHEIKKYWITSQEKINLDGKIKFFKTHHSNCKIDNYSFTNKNCTLATIYVVRDPRNLVDSISNHFNKTAEDSKKFILTPTVLSLGKEGNLKVGRVITYVGTWKEHYQFWTKKNKNLLLIRYEDLVKNINNELSKIIEFLKKFVDFKVTDKKIENIINSTSFESLKKIEENGIFNENVFIQGSNNKIKFFNKGPKNIWQNTLPENIRIELEDELKNEMIELGYIEPN